MAEILYLHLDKWLPTHGAAVVPLANPTQEACLVEGVLASMQTDRRTRPNARQTYAALLLWHLFDFADKPKDLLCLLHSQLHVLGVIGQEVEHLYDLFAHFDIM